MAVRTAAPKAISTADLRKLLGADKAQEIIDMYVVATSDNIVLDAHHIAAARTVAMGGHNKNGRGAGMAASPALRKFFMVHDKERTVFLRWLDEVEASVAAQQSPATPEAVLAGRSNNGHAAG